MTLFKVVVSILVVLWMAFIFSRSLKAADESNEESGRIVSITSEAMEKITSMPVVQTATMSHKIRKTAHFMEYALLGFISCAAFALWLGKKYHSTLCSLVFSFITACTDELLQTFTEGRSGSLRDVLIDIAGALTGILIITLLFIIIKKYFKRIINDHNNEDEREMSCTQKTSGKT